MSFQSLCASINNWLTLPGRIADLERKIDIQSRLIRERVPIHTQEPYIAKVHMRTEDYTGREERARGGK